MISEPGCLSLPGFIIGDTAMPENDDCPVCGYTSGVACDTPDCPGKSALDGFKVVCDERNNPPESIEQGYLRADVTVPHHAISLRRILMGFMRDIENLYDLETDEVLEIGPYGLIQMFSPYARVIRDIGGTVDQFAYRNGDNLITFEATCRLKPYRPILIKMTAPALVVAPPSDTEEPISDQTV